MAIRHAAGIQCWLQKPGIKVLVSATGAFAAFFSAGTGLADLNFDLLFAAIVCLINPAKVARSQKELHKEYTPLFRKPSKHIFVTLQTTIQHGISIHI
jgi:hypothetical protein